jgi:diguanylate cyclase (GGDEF)-like protein
MESIATLLVGSAVLIMAVAAAATIWQLVCGLPVGRMRSDWYVLLAFIACFIAGYLYYLISSRGSYDSVPDLIAPAMFFMGAGFVALVARIMLRTTRDLLRVSSLETESTTDPLTGLNNRRAFDRCWNVELARAKRFSLPLSLLVIDIDHFKSVNDSYGHATGDQVLIRVGQVICNCLRQTDVAARYGGEEFAVITPHTAPKMAAMVAGRVRAAVERDACQALGQHGSGQVITVSVGVAGSDDLALNTQGMFERADEALYQAKRAGRNCVEIAAAVNATPADFGAMLPTSAH